MTTLNRRIGSITFPLSDDSELDRSQRVLLGLFRAALESDFSGVWATRAQKTPLASTNSPVESVYLLEPDNETIRQLKPRFPALFVYTGDTETHARFSVARSVVTKTWGVEWILGPLDPEQASRMRPLLNAFGPLLTEICLTGGHPAYAMDARNVHPAQVLFEDDANGAAFSTARVSGFTVGAASITGESPLYWAAHVTIETTEVSGVASATEGTVPHVGATFTASDEADEDDPEAFDVVTNSAL